VWRGARENCAYTLTYCELCRSAPVHVVPARVAAMLHECNADEEQEQRTPGGVIDV
jgi:hypothetical protein